MALLSNVAFGVRSAPHSTANRRGTSCPKILVQLVCGLLLLAPSTSGIGIRGRQDPADPLNVASNEAGLAVSAVEQTREETEDTLRLAKSEQKRISSHLQAKAKSQLPAALADGDGNTNYLIASFPEFRCVNYVRLPDLVWRPLIVTALASPKALVVDKDRNRLYITDTAVVKIYMYQLLPLGDGTLITDGRQHVAVQNVAVRNMALDLEGNLWFAAASTPVPPTPSIDAIYKQSLIVINNGLLSGTPIDPIPIWTNGATGSTVSPLALDAFNIFYGNDLEGTKKGSLVKAGQGGGGGVTAMATNVGSTLSVAVTPTGVFYGAEKAIYGVLKTKSNGECGNDNANCPIITDQVQKPTAMLWDGDGTIYVADAGAGAIYSFASGSISPHALDKIIDAGEVWGMGVYTKTPADQSSARRCVFTSVATAIVASFAFAIRL